MVAGDPVDHPAAAHDLVVSGRQIGGEEAANLGVVNMAVAADAVLPRSLELGASMLGKDGQTLTTVKRRMYPISIGHLSRAL